MPDILPKIFRLIQKSSCHRNFKFCCKILKRHFSSILPATFFTRFPLTIMFFHLLQTNWAWQISLKLRSLSIFSSISGGKRVLICSSCILSSLLILENWFSFVLSLAFWLSSSPEKTSVTKFPKAFTVKSKVFEFTILLESKIQVWCYLVKSFQQTSYSL